MQALSSDILRDHVLSLLEVPVRCAVLDPEGCGEGEMTEAAHRAVRLSEVCRRWWDLVRELRGPACRMHALPSGICLCATHQAAARALWLALWHRHYRANANPFTVESAHAGAGLDAVVRATKLPFAVRHVREDALSVLVTDSSAWWHAYRAWRARREKKRAGARARCATAATGAGP